LTSGTGDLQSTARHDDINRECGGGVLTVGGNLTMDNNVNATLISRRRQQHVETLPQHYKGANSTFTPAHPAR